MSRYQLDGYAALERVRSELASFLRSTFRLASPQLDQGVHRLIEDEGLLAPRVVEPTFPYEEPSEAPRTLAELVDAGLVHRDLPGLLENAEGEARWPAKRPLYTHQIEAIKRYREGKSIVVASGTGSGKTECFLLPTIDNVLRDPDLAKPGVRVLLVYPLNALVNNQMDRLRAILGHHPTIRFALYTRRLAETEKIAQRKLRNSGRKHYPAEVISREVLRANPPHIVVTNFSMLEYALVRPADASLFGAHVEKPRLCVLDEAHVYAGSLAAELTLLLRRAWLRWGLSESPQGIVTSATMHQGVDDGPEKLLAFATKLLSKKSGEVVSIAGRRVLPADVGRPLDLPPPSAGALSRIDLDFPTLRDFRDDEGKRGVQFETNEKARAGVDAALAALARTEVRGGAPALDLWKALEPLTWVRKLRQDLHHARAERLDQLALPLFPDDAPEVRERAVLNVLALLSVARSSPEGLPLLPVRIHGVVRGPHGVYACIEPSCSERNGEGRVGALYPDQVGQCSCGGLTLELRVCEGCGQSFLGAAEGEDDEGLPALLPTGKDIALFVPGTTWDDGTPIDSPQTVHVFPNGRLAADGDGATWTRFDGARPRGATQQLVDVACPKCQSRIPHGSVLRRIEAGTDAALQVVVDGLYPSLPKHPDAEKEWLPGEGRRALLFADNRQVAAAMAAKIEESHDVLLARVLLVRALEEASKSATSLEGARIQAQIYEALQAGRTDDAQRLMSELAREAKSAPATSVGYERLRSELASPGRLRELSTFRPGDEDDYAQMVITRELGRRPARRGNLEAAGVVSVVYPFSVPAPQHPDLSASFSAEEWTSLVQVVLDVMRTSGFVSPPVLSWKARQQLQLKLLGKTLHRSPATNQRTEAEQDDDDERGRHIALLRANATRPSRVEEYVSKVLARRQVPPTVRPLLVLEQVWNALLAAARASNGALVLDGDGLRMPIQGLRFQLGSKAAHWSCRTCKTVWARQVSTTCPTAGCTGELQLMDAGALDARDRLVTLSRSDMTILGLKTEEHTAQIGVERLEEREQDFKAGKVNVLTSSTTMELGIDIGGLSATVLTNVPPGASNYLQRAGRAGRRAEGSSLVLTYARPRPFDQAAFIDPLRPFRDRIVPPVVRLDTDRIVRRHVNAFLLAYFFRAYEAQGDVAVDPMSSLRIISDFFFRPIRDVLVGNANAEGLIELAGGSGATLSDAFGVWLTSEAAELGTRAAIAALVRGTSLETHEHRSLCEVSAVELERISQNAREQWAFLSDRIAEENARPEATRDRGAITALELQKGDLEKAKLLGYLAEEQYLPRYGFPVQVVSLDHRFDQAADDKRPVEEDDSELRLSRDISLAISEYAPGADVVAAKEVHRSRGVLRHWTGKDAPGVLANRYVAVCQACGQLQYARTEGEIRRPCPTCREGEPRSIRVLEPRQGFAVQWGTRPKRWISGSKQPLRPVTEVAYAARDGQHLAEVSSGLGLGYDPEGQILVRAEGQLDPTELPGAGAPQAGVPRAGYGYAVCYLCGRAEPEVHAEGRNVRLPPGLRGHQRLRGSGKCESTTQYWRNTILAGAVRTETLCFQLRGPLQFPSDIQGRRWATTWMVALQLSAGEVLGIDSRSFGSLLVPRSTPSGVVHDALLYDQIAGGAGLCRALRERWRDLLEAVRKRLHCTNPRCSNACHQCLIAFETQRYEELLRRSELAEFLDAHWEELVRQPVRDGLEVTALLRGRFELLETIKRAPSSSVMVFTPTIASDALDEDGWLRPLLLHADAGGRLRLVVEAIPDSDEDSERFLARRLGTAIESGRCELVVVKEGTLTGFGWKLVVTEPAHAFYFDEAGDAGLGTSWLSHASNIHAPLQEKATRQVLARAEALFAGGKRATPKDFEPPPPPPGVKWQYVPAMVTGAQATFTHWLKGPDNESLFARPLRELAIVDPYIASKWQLKLLDELCELARKAGSKRIAVDTYAPERDKGNNVYPEEQRDRIRKATGDQAWAPRHPPTRNADKLHKRLIRGTREDGTRFEVLLERGIDFITERDRGTRSTRETFIIVRDPA